MTTPAEELRAAATKLRETAAALAAEATPPQQPLMWFAEDLITGSTLAGGDADALDHKLTRAEIAWIVLMSPALAEPLAALLEAVAASLSGNWHAGNEYCDLPLAIAGQTGDGVNTCRCPDVHSALAVARAILGEVTS